MHFEDAEIDQPSPNNNKSKVLGVIVLTDNRQTPQNLKSKPSELRSSAFKETQVDPLDLEPYSSSCTRDENLLAELTRRVTYLQRRIEALSKNQVLSNEDEKPQNSSKKKNRRKFKDLQRNHECVVCRKVYGSQTSLKYHLKLKHSTEKGYSQVQ